LGDKTESEIRRLAVVVKNSNDAITVQDLQGKILAWNERAQKMYGYTEAEAIGMSILEIVPDDLQKELIEKLEQISQGIIVEAFETRRICKNRKMLDVWLVITCLRDDSGNIDSVSTTEHDITHVLKGIIPICSSCRDIRDDEGYWHHIESYIKDHSMAEFSHGICPKCAKKLYPEFNPK
jgi:PAS domain S-box-containing protein